MSEELLPLIREIAHGIWKGDDERAAWVTRLRVLRRNRHRPDQLATQNVIALDFNAGRDRASDNLDHALGALISELSRGDIDQEEITNLLAEITEYVGDENRRHHYR
jgi:hypothetical protein